MLFDCLGLAVGLWASVAAMWKPDGRYTFGYSRVETLSGFANGCFLILISVFIIFEAIQRVCVRFLHQSTCTDGENVGTTRRKWRHTNYCSSRG